MKENTRGSKSRGVSLDDDDAIDVGLFGPGPARIVESIFTTYDYQGTSRRPPLVWLVTFERPGEKKGKPETYEQPFTIGKGWDASKDGRELIPKNGQTGLPKSCNAILYLIKPLKKALKEAKLDLDLSTGDPSLLEGMEVVLDRIDQQERDIRDKDDDRGRGRDRDRDKDRGRGRDDDKGPKTILVIDEVVALPGDADEKPARSSKSKKDDKDDEEDDEPKSRHKDRGKEKDDEDEDEEKPAAKGKGRGSSNDDDEATEGDQDEDDAVEAIIAAVESGPVNLKDLESKLAKILKKNKRADAIIDLATAKAFLKKEKGWSFDGKTIDAEDDGKTKDKDEDEEEEKPRSRRR